MRSNPDRRRRLLDAAIDVLAREGARGLSFRAVDVAADVPQGTASNYFANRDDLLIQVANRYYERLQPDDATMALLNDGPKTRDTVKELIQETVERVGSFETGYLALLELRLEASRRPALRELLTQRIRADVELNVANHLKAGLPGDEQSVLLLYLAMNWLIVERLTVPGAISSDEATRLVDTAVDRFL